MRMSLAFLLLLSLVSAATNTITFNYPLWGLITGGRLFGCTNQGPKVTVGFLGDLKFNWGPGHGQPPAETLDIKLVARGGNGKHSDWEEIEDAIGHVNVGPFIQFEKSPSNDGCTGNPYIFVDANNDGRATLVGRCSELRKNPIDLPPGEEICGPGNVGVQFQLDCDNSGSDITLSSLRAYGELGCRGRVECRSKNRKFTSSSTDWQYGDVDILAEGVEVVFEKAPSAGGVTGNPELGVLIKRNDQEWEDVAGNEVSIGKCIQGNGGGKPNSGAIGAAAAASVVGLGAIVAYVRRRRKAANTVAPLIEETLTSDDPKNENVEDSLEVQMHA